jgi:hypothetical protein
LLVAAWILIALSAAVAVRMARVGLAQKSAPESLLAVFFMSGSLGYGVVMLAPTLGIDAETASWIGRTSESLLVIPCITMGFFTTRVFRPGAAWASGLAWSLCVLNAGTALISYWLFEPLGLQAYFSIEIGAPHFWLAVTSRTLPFAWSCTEACLFYGRARKQQHAGLMQPLVANRFLLWAIWSGAATGMVIVRVAGFLFAASLGPKGAHAIPLILVSLLMSIASLGAMWLTFAPPAFYKRRLERTTA